VALVAGVHGGKVAAVHALEALGRSLDRTKLHGTVLLVGPANRAGYRAGLAQTSPQDSLNLNRVFPGRYDGSYTERLAAKIVRDVVARSDFLIDMHGSDGNEAVGRFAYAARPGITPSVDTAAMMLALGWGVEMVVWDETGPREFAQSRFLQTAAHLRNVPAITVFAPGSTRVDSDATAAFVSGAINVLRHLDVVRDHFPSGGRIIPLSGRLVTVAAADGEWRAAVSPERPLWPGDLLGVLVSTSGADSLYSSERGFVLHQRLSGPVAAGTPLVILGLLPKPLLSPPAP
jgi:predicted deacylase